VDERVTRFTTSARCAADDVILRSMSEADVPAGMRLVSQAGWNQVEDDWRLFLQLNSQGCTVAVRQGHVVGTVTVLPHGEHLAWIGMLLVDEALRRKGIGTRLLRHAIAQAEEAKVLALDATPAGQPLYERHGFRAGFGLCRMTHDRLPRLSRPLSVGVAPLSERDWPQVRETDRAAFGADRAPLLKALRGRAPERAWCTVRKTKLTGFCLGRDGRCYAQIGPIVAESAEDAAVLFQAAADTLHKRAVVVDVPAMQEPFLAWLSELGFVCQRSLTRMWRSSGDTTPAFASAPTRQWAIAGPELG